MLNIIANTIPIAIELVTYGKKNIVCNNLLKRVIEFKNTAIINAKKHDSGTVNTHNKAVFFKQVTKPA